MTVHTITYRERPSRFDRSLKLVEAYAGSGVEEMRSIACEKWASIGFLVELLLMTPGVTLANSVDVIEISEP